MGFTRRDFVKLCTGSVAGYGISSMFHPFVHEVLAQTLTGERPPVFWIQGAGCTGCSVSILNSIHPAIADVLLKVISLEYHPTLMASEGASATENMFAIAEKFKGKYFVVVEGAIPTAEDGKYCVVAEAHHHEYTLVEMLKKMCPDAAAVLAFGTCSAYGGISAAHGSVTECVNVRQFFENEGISTPVVNVPGCPPHPDWMLGTTILAINTITNEGAEKGLETIVSLLDKDGRPLPFYGKTTHNECPWEAEFDNGIMAKVITDKSRCRYDLGCKGPMAMCDSPTRKWNGKVSWCIENSLCIGCVQPNFPDGMAPFYTFE